jgi:hypothetical protein
MDGALKARLDSGQKWRLWLTVIVAALVLAAGAFLIQRMPGAERLASGDDQLEAAGPQTLALYNLRAAPVIRYDGATGAGLTVSVSTGRLPMAVRNKLFSLGVRLPNVRGAQIQWRGRPTAASRISLRIGNQRQSSDSGLMLQATENAGLNIRAVQTDLTATIEVAPQAVSAPELKFGDVVASDPALASTPIEIEIPPGESMSLTFDSNEALAGSTFTLGEPLGTAGNSAALSLGRAEVGPASRARSFPRLQSVDQGVCASRNGRLLFTHSDPAIADCRLAADQKNDRLLATGLTLQPRKVALALRGSGFVVEDGQARRAALSSALVANPLVAAVTAALIGAIGWAIWRLWMGRDM